MTTPLDPNPLPDHVSRALDAAYRHHAGTSTTPPPASVIVADGAVAATISGHGRGEFPAFLDALRDLDVRVVSSHEVTWAVSAMIPLDRLPEVASLPQVRSIVPRMAPRTS
ncbi:hypothetical protein [Paludisphaera soli]|uniref:hypothetical protein n=1 Tax=Paludisphaera soli TaxID=2712865 RepID=UPI0013ECB670|nr:hypothetical protein [Paludisphaera soli]